MEGCLLRSAGRRLGSSGVRHGNHGKTTLCCMARCVQPMILAGSRRRRVRTLTVQHGVDLLLQEGGRHRVHGRHPVGVLGGQGGQSRHRKRPARQDGLGVVVDKGYGPQTVFSIRASLDAEWLVVRKLGQPVATVSSSWRPQARAVAASYALLAAWRSSYQVIRQSTAGHSPCAAKQPRLIECL